MNHEELRGYISEYLKDEKISLEIKSYGLEESTAGAQISIDLLVCDDLVPIYGSGVGLVDATHDALMGHFGEKYNSLDTLELSDVYFNTDLRSSNDPGQNRKSRMAIVLEFKNASKDASSFRSKTSSVSYATVEALVQAFEFYINCENLFKRMRFLLEDAQSRNRSDVAATYQYVLTKIVKVTNYRCVL